jgi:hypothetical protein
MRPFSELSEDSATQKHAFVECRPAKLVTAAFTSDAGAYRVGFDETLDGIRRDVVGVVTLTETLTRVETSALCQSTASTWYYNREDGISPQLWVHLAGGANPSGTSVVAFIHIPFCSASYPGDWAVQPHYGPEKLTDGELDVWTSPTNLTNWTETTTNGSVDRESTIVAPGSPTGSFSAKLTATNATVLGSSIDQGSHSIVSGGIYEVSFHYMTDAKKPAGLEARISVGIAGGGGTEILPDGRNTRTGTPVGMAVADTYGEWRVGVLHFRAWTDSSAITIAAAIFNAVGGSLSGVVYFDRIKFRRIWGFDYCEPRVIPEGLPVVEVGAEDVYFGTEQVGLGSVQLANGGGDFPDGGASPPVLGAVLERMFSAWDWVGQAVQIRFGGAFADGQEILASDMRPAFPGTVRTHTVTDALGVLELESPHGFGSIILPPRAFDLETFANLEDIDEGRPRAMLFGTKDNIRPACISTTTNVGQYEIADTTDAPNGIFGIQELWAYEDEDAASVKDPLRRINMTGFVGTTADHPVLSDLPNGRFTVKRCLHVFRVTRENNTIDFTIGGGALVATVASGIYVIGLGDDTTHDHGLLNLVNNAMNTAAGVSDITAVCNAATGIVTIAKGAGTLQLLTNTGANREFGLLKMLGFSTAANYTGALSYAGTDAVPHGTKDQILRVTGQGYKDDASGTFTGTANSIIFKAPDILRCIWVKFLNQDPAKIDTASFVAARTSCPQSLGVYLGSLASVQGGAGSTMSVDEIIEALEVGAHADIVADAEGKLFFTPRDDAVPANIVDLYDRDFLAEPAFLGAKSSEGVYKTVRLAYHQDPTLGTVKTREVTTASVSIQYGRHQSRPFYCFLNSDADANTEAINLNGLALGPIRHFTFAVKGKLLELKYGDLVRITRSQAFGSIIGGSFPDTLPSGVFRVIRLRKNYLTHRVEVTVHTNVVPA